jgi:outer membrane protein assembly factor BamA
MKKLLCILFLSFVFLSAYSAEGQDSIGLKNKQRVKRGITVAPLPTLGYDTDLGFQYGLSLSLYNFGDGTRYPQYNHYLYLEYSRYTKGGQIARLSFDSDRIIKNIRTTLDITFNDDRLAYFYGFNGYVSIYDKAQEEKNRIFYRYSNTSLRAKLIFQGNFGNTYWGWEGGLNCYHFNARTVDVNRLNANKKASQPDLLPNSTLYDKYVDWGMISYEETLKNWVNYLQLGFKYDSRDNRSNPFSGMFSEVILQTAPSFVFNKFPHTKAAFVHRHYVPIVPKKFIFAYRIFYQSTIGNSKVPFYIQPLLMNSFEIAAATQGLGGARSLRGVSRNRVVGDGFLMANTEFRLKLFNFRFLKQYVDVLVNAFVDAGYITKKINISEQLSNLPEDIRSEYFEDTKQTIHASGGVGGKLVLNDNFVLSLDLGHAFDKRDGEGFKLYLNANYSF